jgi:hypothetical protein
MARRSTDGMPRAAARMFVFSLCLPACECAFVAMPAIPDSWKRAASSIQVVMVLKVHIGAETSG